MKIKNIISFIFTLFPFSKLRIFLLNLFPSNKITFNSHIGFCNYIDAKKLHIVNSTIGSFNRIIGLNIYLENSSVGKLNVIKYVDNYILEDSMIYNRNSFIGTIDDSITETDKNNFIMQKKSLITHRHYFDLSFGITIGKNVVFGGEETQCWTHGYDCNRILKGGPIVMGDNIYVGSRSMVLPNTTITNKVTIAAGTIVHKNITNSGVYASNNLMLKKSYEENK